MPSLYGSTEGYDRLPLTLSKLPNPLHAQNYWNSSHLSGLVLHVLVGPAPRWFSQGPGEVEFLIDIDNCTDLCCFPERANAVLSGCKHVTATVYTDQELAFVCEEDAPGIGSYRDKLGSLLTGYVVSALPHEETISKLERVAEKFRVLLIKSNTRIPYTSVFFELECGYWDLEGEERLRAAMESAVRSANTLTVPATDGLPI